MLIDNKKTFVVATPTKTGSESLEKDVYDYSLGERLENYTKHSHVYYGDVKKRFLLVRNPLERFSSIYHYLLGHKFSGNDSVGLFDAIRKEDLNLFCKRYFEASKKNIWTLQLVDYVESFKPTKVFKLEEGLEVLLKEFGKVVQPSVVNKSRRNAGYDKLQEGMTAVNKRNIKNLHSKSMKVLRYL